MAPSLGGSGGDSENGPLSPEELRRRRLFAMSGLSPSTTTQPNPPSLKPPTPGGNELADIPPQSMSVTKKATFVVDDDEDEDLQAALALSMQAEMAVAEDDTEEEEYDMDIWYQSRDPFDISAFHSLMWDATLTTTNDKARWVSQGIDVRQVEPSAIKSDKSSELMTMMDVVSESHLPWGLTQQHGGPCGVLAAIQADVLRLLLWGSRKQQDQRVDYPIDCSVLAPAEPLVSELFRRCLARSIGLILARAALTPSVSDEGEDPMLRKQARVVLLDPVHSNSLSWEDMEPWVINNEDESITSRKLVTYTISLPDGTAAGPKRQKTHDSSLAARIFRLARAVSAFLETPINRHGAPLDSFQRQGGVVLVVMSLLASRGKSVIQQEFDDSGSKLTSQFGHCSQELINLLLTGQAVSNVFDNTLRPSGDMVCRGIQNRPDVGYLSQLESMRYCEVGSFYKTPRFPVWVIGSTSHFTVLFGDSSALSESKSDILLEQCRRAFKSIEGGEENGFIASSHLNLVFEALELDVGGEAAIQTLAASIEVAGAGIILWDDFWKAVSRLMTGASLETVLQGDENFPQLIDLDDDPPLLLPNGSLDVDNAVSEGSIGWNRVETDEEMARRLDSEFNTQTRGVGLSGLGALNAVARAASPMQVDQGGLLSDEELARKLQAEWDAEFAGSSDSIGAVNGSSPTPTLSDSEEVRVLPPTPPPSRRIVMEDSKPPAQDFDAPKSAPGDEYGDRFQLRHYNGLRVGNLATFQVTRLTAEEAVGSSTALNRAGGTGTSSYSRDLEEVVRTKWPSCLIDWMGQNPPYID